MKGYLIDPLFCRLETVDVEPGLAGIKEHVQAALIDCVRLPNGDDIWIDEEGLINHGARRLGLFHVEGHIQPLAGYGLVLGHDGEGGSTDPHESLDYYKERVSWMNVNEAIDYAYKHDL